MLQKNKEGHLFLPVLFFFLLLLSQQLKAQIYFHDFGTGTISSYPYTTNLGIINSNISGSSWTNSTGAWSSNVGYTGQAITLFNTPGVTTITLTLTVASGYEANITSFDFWRQRSNSGPQNWAMSINGISAGGGSIPTSGALIGNTPVSNPVTGLTGTINVVLSLSNASGNGNFRLDNFTLNGSVVSNCNTAQITSFIPASGPKNTIVSISGSGFTGATSVKFDAIPATYTIISNILIEATVPASVNTGTISVTASDGCEGTANALYTFLDSECGSPEIYISEIYDAYSNSPGAIELYNPTSTSITFNGSYKLQRYGTIDVVDPGSQYNLILPGSIAPNSTYLINSGPAPCGIVPVTNMGSGINASDQIRLLKNDILIDVVNAPGEVGYSVIRKPNAIAPEPVFNGMDWNTSTTESCTNLGMHTTNNVSAPLPAITQPLDRDVCENGSTTFSVQVTPSTGFTYQWKMLNTAGTWVNVINSTNYSGATTALLTITNTPIGFNNNQYYCAITSSECNIVSDAAQLFVTALPVPTVNPTQPTCAVSTGTIVINAPTGMGLTYSIDGITYSTATTYNNLPQGSYPVTVKNAAGCTSAITTQVINAAPAAPVAPNVNPTQPTCAVSTGSIVITAPTGLGLTYSVDGVTYTTATTYNNLPQGSYPVTVKNAAGCISSVTTQVINATPAAPVAPTVNPTQPTCAISTGTIVISAPTGMGLTYSIDGVIYSTATTYNNLPQGSYPVTVKNASGCTSAITTQVINSAPAAPVAPTVNPTQPTCTISTGTILISAPTGMGLTYSIDGITYSTATTYNNLPQGSYPVTVKNASGCTSAITTQVINTVPTAPSAPTVNPTQPTCAVSTGSIVITAPTGLGLTYSIDGVTYSAATTYNNLPQGSYPVTVKNAAGCISAITTQVINSAPAAPVAPTVNPTQPTCSISTGTIVISAPTGMGLTYSIDSITYSAATTYNNLPQGSYPVTVKNAAGCISAITTQVISVVPVAPIAPTVNPIQPTCSVSTGSIVISAPAGTGLTYSIDGVTYSAATTYNNLPQGSYQVTVKNAAGCISAITTQVINAAPAAPVAPTVNPTQPTCTVTTGSIAIAAPTGMGLTYSIDGITYSAATTYNNLPQGSYLVTVKNAAGCISAITTQIINAMPNVPATPNAITGNAIACVGEAVQLSNTTTGGTWLSSNTALATVDTDGLVTPLNPGNVVISYTVGTLGTACTASVTKTIQINTLPEPELESSYFLCLDSKTGFAEPIILNSGLNTGNYSFTWTKGNQSLASTNAFIMVSQPGTYTVTATNLVTGCSGIATTVVGSSSIATAYAEVGLDFHLNQIITVYATGGSGVYEYSLDGGPYQAEPYFTGITDGEYEITVRDVNGCGMIKLDVFALNYPRFFSPNGDGNHDHWNIKGLRQQPNALILIYDRYGKIIVSVKPSQPGWDGTYNGHALPATDYWFTVMYQSPNSTPKEFKAHFSLLR